MNGLSEPKFWELMLHLQLEGEKMPTWNFPELLQISRMLIPPPPPHQTCLGIQHSVQQRMYFQVRSIEDCSSCQKWAPFLLTRQRLLDVEDRRAWLVLEIDKVSRGWANRGAHIPRLSNHQLQVPQNASRVPGTQWVSSVLIIWTNTKETRAFWVV